MDKQKSLEQLYIAAEQYLESHDFQQAQQAAWQQLDSDPLSETAAAQLMTALAKSGQRSAAMAQYEMYRRRLEEASGAEPSAELSELYQRIQNDELQQTMLRYPAKQLPDGVINPIFCYTDIESSTRLWDEHREAMLWALRQHNDLCETEIERFDGRILHPTGDGFLIVFEQNDPLQFAIALQQRFAQADWGEIGELRIRIGFHGATADQEGHEYFPDDGGWYRGPVLNHAARIADTGHGGQIVASDMVKEYCPLPPGATWEDLGSHNLKSLDEAYHIYSLLHPDLALQEFPALRTPANRRAAQADSGIRGYELGQIIGQGAFGEVYRAQQPGIARDVAVKIIRSQYANRPDFIRRFEMEAQVIARLEHPYIVPLYDYWREAGGAYLVMRYMKGGSLKGWLEDGPLDFMTAIELLDQIGAALAFAHEHGFVHRDIKPANILLDEDGNGYLSDFGIVKDISAGKGEADELAVGTPAYLSPEQARHEPVTPLSDQYSLGVMLYEMLAGARPFGDSSPANLIDLQLHEPLPLVTAAQPEIPPAVDEAIQQATAKNPDGRFPDIGALLNALHRAARQVDAAYPKPARLQLAEQDLVNPYKGLRSFQEADSANFFGRRQLTDQLLNRLATQPAAGDLPTDCFLAVVGPSGSGKSSVVKAGLLPALRRGLVRGSENWFIVEMMPGAHPFEELEAALLRVAVEPPEMLLALLQEDDGGLRRAVAQILPDDGSDLLLLIDQFEELYTLVEDEVIREQFIDCLLGAIQADDSRVHLVVTLRADFYDRPLMMPDLAALMRHCTEIVPPMTRSELEEVIVQPAAQAGVMFEGGLVSAIMSEVVEQPGALPLLQYALTELFERRQERLLSRAAYESIGGVLGALGRRAEELFAQLDQEGQEAARQLFMRLVTLGEGTEDTRRRVPRAELTVLGNPAVMDSVIDAYGRYRLLTFDRDPLTREPTVEVAHEALIREWERLRGWLDESRDDVRLQRSLALFATEWAANNETEGFLLRDSRLDLLSSWAEETTLALTPMEKDYLQASIAAREARVHAEQERQRRELETAQELAREQSQRAEEQSRSARRLRLLVAGLAIVLLLAIGAAWFAVDRGQEARSNADLAATREAVALSEANQRATAQAIAQLRSAEAETERQRADEERNLAQYAQATAEAETVIRTAAEQDALQQRENALTQASIGLASQADLELAGDQPERSILLALEAIENYPYTWQAERALSQAVFQSHLELILNHDAIVTTAFWSGDGTRLLTASKDGKAHLWDAQTGEKVHTFNHGEGDVYAHWSPTFDRILTYGSNGSAKLWDAASWELIHTLSGHEQEILSVGWSPVDDRLLSTGADAVAIVWDASSGEELSRFTGHETPVYACDFAGCFEHSAWSPEGDRVVTTDTGSGVFVWDPYSGEELLSIDGHDEWVNTASFSPSGDRIATASDDDTAAVWDAVTGEEIARYAGGHGNILGAFWSPDGTRLLSNFNMEDLVLVWDPETGEEIVSFKEHGQIPWFATWSADGRQVLSGAGDGTARIWNSETGVEYHVFRGHTLDIRFAQWSPDGSRLVTASEDGTAKIWRLKGPLLVNEIPGDDGGSWAFGWSPDGQRVVRSFEEGRQKVFDAQSGEVLLSNQIHERIIFRTVFSPSGEEIASADSGGRLVVWDSTSGEISVDVVSEHGGIWNVNWSPDGSKVAAGTFDGAAIIWDAKTGEELLVFTEHEDGIPGVAWSPDGQKLATSDSVGQTMIWDAASGEVLLDLYPPDFQYFTVGTAWSSDGRKLATQTADGVLSIWDTETGEELQSMPGFTGSAWRISWFSVNRRLLTADANNEIKIWDVEAGNEVASIKIEDCLGAWLSPDGTQVLAVISPDGPLIIFNIWQSLDELVELAKDCCLVRDLTPEERTQLGLALNE